MVPLGNELFPSSQFAVNHIPDKLSVKNRFTVLNLLLERAGLDHTHEQFARNNV